MRSDNGQRRRFRYERRDPRLIEERATQPTSNYATLTKPQFPVFKSRAGTNKLRVLPPTWEDADHYAYNLIIHYNVGPDGDRYLCAKMLGKPCAVCEERVRLMRQGEADASKQLRPQDSRIAWVVDRDKESEGPQLWLFGKVADIEFAVLSRDEDSGDTLYIDDPDEGYDISFRCDNPGPHAKYSARRVSRRSTPLSDKKQDDWLEYIQKYPAPDTLNFYPYKKLVEALGGGASSGEEEDPDLGPIRRRSLREDDDERTQDEDETYDQETGEVEDDRGAPFDTEDERSAPEERMLKGKSRGGEDEPPRRNWKHGEDQPTRTRLRPQEEDPNPSRQARENLRQLRPPGQRPSQRER